MGKGGWEALAGALKANPNKVWCMEGSREGLAEARREDMKDLWEAVGHIFMVWKKDWEMCDRRQCIYLAARKPGDTWTDLERILDLTKLEFKAEAGRMVDMDSDEWAFDSDDEDEESEENEENKDEENEHEKDENGSQDEERVEPDD